MPKVDLPCPECGRLLRLPDRSLLGRKGKCGKCGHKFILREPKRSRAERLPPEPHPEIHFESLDDPDAAGRDGDATPVGSVVQPAAAQIRGNDAGAAQPLIERPQEPPAPDDPNPLDFLVLEPESDVEHQARLRRTSRTASRRQKALVAGSAVVAAVLGLALYFGLHAIRSPKKSPAEHLAAKAGHTSSADREDVSEPATDSGSEKPGAADPITLKLVPEGARIVIHLRPAELWQQGGSAEEFRACLGPLATWLENVIKTRCLLDPSRIEEALFALIPVSRDSFETAFVVRAAADFRKSELMEKDLGELVDRPRQHYLGRERAWLIFDARTYASAPRSMAQSLLDSADGETVTSEGIDALLSHTDRRRHFTLLCDLEDVRLGAGTIAPENAQGLLEAMMDFFGDYVETIAWSVHLGDPDREAGFVSDLFIRNRSSRSTSKLHDELKKKLADLPEHLLKLVYQTNPRTIGEKKIVGRFPIMTKVVERSAETSSGPRLVTMHLELPERAGPNLALGTLLTWNQTTLLDFGKSSSAPVMAASGEPKLPEKIADRLKKKISVDFRREFMDAAIAYIEGETGVKIKLDGPGMKEVGITQNMYQTFAMENVPATAALHKIIVENTGNKLVLIVDEKNKIATVTSTTTAKNKKLTPFPLEPGSK